MPSKHSPYAALLDIKENILRAGNFLDGMEFSAFCQDNRTIYAVTRCLEIISEASRRLPDDLKTRHPHIPWRAVAGAGNVYRHGYDEVDEMSLWETVRHDLPPLLQVVDSELPKFHDKQ